MIRIEDSLLDVFAKKDGKMSAFNNVAQVCCQQIYQLKVRDV